MQGDRVERVAEQMRHVVAVACLTEIDDPRLDGVQITLVRMTKDLRIARIYFQLIHGHRQTREEAVKGLRESISFLRKKIAEEINLKFVPSLEIFYDETADEEQRIEELFKQLEEEQIRE